MLIRIAKAGLGGRWFGAFGGDRHRLTKPLWIPARPATRASSLAELDLMINVRERPNFEYFATLYELNKDLLSDKLLFDLISKASKHYNKRNKAIRDYGLQAGKKEGEFKFDYMAADVCQRMEDGHVEPKLCANALPALLLFFQWRLPLGIRLDMVWSLSCTRIVL